MGASQNLDGDVMDLFICSPAEIDAAWRNGAHKLSEACKRASREITPDQLKMLLARGERTLIGCREGVEVKGWAAIQVQQLPNIRVLHIYSIYAPGCTSVEMFARLKDYARANGCSAIRGAADDAVARLWERRFNAQKLYHIMEFDV